MEHNEILSIDGSSMKFYQTMWSYIKDKFNHHYLEEFVKISLGPIINKGLIKLLTKGRNEHIISS